MIQVVKFMRRLVIEVMEQQRSSALRSRRFVNPVAPAVCLASGHQDDAPANKTATLSIASLLPQVGQACGQPVARASAWVRDAGKHAETGVGRAASNGIPERPRMCQATLPPGNKPPLAASDGQFPGPAAVAAAPIDGDESNFRVMPETDMTPSEQTAVASSEGHANLDLTFATPQQRNGQFRPWQAMVSDGNKPPLSALDGQPPGPTVFAALDDGLALDVHGQTPGPTLATAWVRDAGDHAGTGFGRDADGGNRERPSMCQGTLPPVNIPPLAALDGQLPGPAADAAVDDGLALDMDGQTPGPTLATAWVRDAGEHAETGVWRAASDSLPERPRKCQETLPPGNEPSLAALDGQLPGPAAVAAVGDGLALGDGQLPAPTAGVDDVLALDMHLQTSCLALAAALDGQPPTPTVVAAGVDDGFALVRGQDPGLAPAAALEEGHSDDALGLPTDRGASGAADASEG